LCPIWGFRYASYAAKEVDIIRALVIALNLRALNSTRGYVLFTHNSDDAFKAIVAKYDRPELRNALNFRFGKFPDATMDPVLTTPPKFINLKQWRFAWIKVILGGMLRGLWGHGVGAQGHLRHWTPPPAV